MTDTLRQANPDRFAADVELLGLADEDFIYSADMQALFSLNTTAAFIWRGYETGKPLDEVVNDTAHHFQLSSLDARAYVNSALEEWRKCGLLEGAPRTYTDVRDNHARNSKVPEKQRTGPVGKILESRVYAVLDTTFEITCQTATQAEGVFAVVGHLEIAADTGHDSAQLPPRRIDIVGGDGAQEIFADGQLVHRCDTPTEIAPLIHWQVFSSAVDDDRNLLQLHTAAVGREGRALLLPGPSGSGKSTLSMALLERGFGYLSDDMVVVDRDSFLVRGLPFSICVKESGLALLERGTSAPASPQLHLRADGRRVHYRHPRAGSLVVEPQAASWVVFPRYTPDAAGDLRVISPAEALRRLLGLSAPPRHLPRETAIAVMDWVAKLKCCELEFSDTRAAVDAILEFCG